MFDLRLKGAGGRLGQEGVGVPPEEVGGEGEGQGESVHAGGEADGGHLHLTGGAVLADRLYLGEAARTLAREPETSSEEVCQTPGTLKIDTTSGGGARYLRLKTVQYYISILKICSIQYFKLLDILNPFLEAFFWCARMSFLNYLLYFSKTIRTIGSY